MKRATLIAVLGLATIGLTGILATNVYAYPGYTVVPCVQACHHTTKPVGDPSLNPTSTPAGLIPTTTVDATCAVTVSNAVSSYRGDAVLHLSATDNVGGWGVGYLYYSLDGAPVRLIRVPVDWTNSMGSMSCETSIPVAAPASGHVAHTISFWSQDNYGNVETPTTQAFTIAAPPVLTVATTALSFKSTPTTSYSGHKFVFTGKISPASMASGTRITIWMRKAGQDWGKMGTTYTNVYNNYTFTLYNGSRAHGKYYVRTKYAGNSVYASSYSPYKTVYVK